MANDGPVGWGLYRFMLVPMKLYNHFRWSAPYRVLIALGLKGLAYKHIPVNLLRGEQLLPADALGCARVRALAQSVACEIHPLNNLRVLKYLVNDMGVREADKNRWYAHGIRQGLEGFDRQSASGTAGAFCHGAAPMLADCLLVPQVFNAQRFNVSLDGLSRVQAVFAACMHLDAFSQTPPSACPYAQA